MLVRAVNAEAQNDRNTGRGRVQSSRRPESRQAQTGASGQPPCPRACSCPAPPQLADSPRRAPRGFLASSQASQHRSPRTRPLTIDLRSPGARPRPSVRSPPRLRSLLRRSPRPTAPALLCATSRPQLPVPNLQKPPSRPGALVEEIPAARALEPT